MQKYNLISPNIYPNTYTTFSTEDAAKYFYNVLENNNNSKYHKYKISNANKEIEILGFNINQHGGNIDENFLIELDDASDNILNSIINLKELITKRKQNKEPILFILNEKIDNLSKKVDELINDNTINQNNELIQTTNDEFPTPIKVDIVDEKDKGFCTIS